MSVTLTDPVRAGQVWADLDKRSAGRELLVLEVVREVNGVPLIDPYAVVASPTGRGRKTRIRLDRFRASTTGYRLVRDTPETSPEAVAGRLGGPGTCADGCSPGSDALRPQYVPARRARRTPIHTEETS